MTLSDESWILIDALEVSFQLDKLIGNEDA